MLLACVLLNTGLVFWVESSFASANELEDTVDDLDAEESKEIKYALRFLLALHVCNFVVAFITVPSLCFSLGYLFAEAYENRDFVEGAPLDKFIFDNRVLQNLFVGFVIILVGQAKLVSSYPTLAALVGFATSSSIAILSLPVVIFTFIKGEFEILGYLTSRTRYIYMLVPYLVHDDNRSF